MNENIKKEMGVSNKRKRYFCVVTFLVLIVVHIGVGNDINSGMSGIMNTMDAHTRKDGRLRIGIGLKADIDGGFVSSDSGCGTVINKNGEAVDAGTQAMYSMVGHADYIVLPFASVGLALPFYYDVTGWGENASGLGDLQFSYAMSFPFQKPDAIVDFGFCFGYIIPTGTAHEGYFSRHIYHLNGNHSDRTDPGNTFYTTNRLSLFVRTLFTLHFNRTKINWPLTLNVNINSRVVTKERQDNAEIGGIGIIYHGLNKVSPFMEVSWEFRDSYRWANSIDLKKFRYEPVKLGLGAKFNIKDGMESYLCANISLSKDNSESRTYWNNNGYLYSTRPNSVFGVVAGISWSGLGKAPEEMPFKKKKESE